jgi:glycosyltransferase involved in cell wall biosynthesis
MILGIDASNIRAGGGLTHLKEVLKFANPSSNNFQKVVVWSSTETLKQLSDEEWLTKETHRYLNNSFIGFFLFQLFVLKRVAKAKKCAVVFSPGGTFLCTFRPFVTMSQNMLPFELKEAFRFKRISTRIRFLALRLTQSNTFRRADGLIFLTSYAKHIISGKIGSKKLSATIPHGIDKAFLKRPKEQYPPSHYSREKPFELLYVSIVTAYKHQWIVAEAVCQLNEKGYPIRLQLIGPKGEEGFNRLQKVLNLYPISSKCIFYSGAVPHKRLFSYYNEADAFVFASSCENMPIILIEAMTAGLPIACSNRGPMPEVLLDAGLYFDPENVEETYLSLKELFLNQEKRTVLANNAYNRTINYTWESCSNDTFAFLAKVANSTYNEK